MCLCRTWGNRVCVRKVNVLNNLAQLPFHIYPHSMCLRWSQHPSLLVIKTVEDLTNSFHLTFHICKAKTLYATDQCTTTLNTFNLAGSHLRLAVPSKFSCGPNAILPEFILSQQIWSKGHRKSNNTCFGNMVLVCMSIFNLTSLSLHMLLCIVLLNSEFFPRQVAVTTTSVTVDWQGQTVSTICWWNLVHNSNLETRRWQLHTVAINHFIASKQCFLVDSVHYFLYLGKSWYQNLSHGRV